MLRYLDEGEPGWRPLLFFGGLGTSVRAFELTEFARSTRQRLRLRTISVERNGFGETPLEPSAGIVEAVDDVLFVLDRLGVDRFVLVAISGGGPYAAALAARVPDRLISLHLAAAAAGGLPIAEFPSNPAELWRFPAGSYVHQIPGFIEAAVAEGARAIGHRDGPAALAREWQLLRDTPLPPLRRVRAPAYLYYGAEDEIVAPDHAESWRAVLGGPVTLRFYDGEAHDVQYRHWDQVLLDAAGPDATLP